MKKFMTKAAAAVALTAAALTIGGVATAASDAEANAAGLWPYSVKTNAGLWPY